MKRHTYATILATVKKSRIVKGILLFECIVLFILFLSFVHLQRLTMSLKQADSVFAEKQSNKEVLSETEFSSNELLVKVTKNVKDKVKAGNPEDTGLPSLNAVFREHNVQSFEKIGKPGKKSKKDADIFAWYKVSLDATKTIIKGNVDKVTGRILSNDPASKKLQNIVDRLLADPSLEAVEPNYVANTSMDPNDPYFISAGSWGQTYDDLWGLKKINLSSAWEQTTGSATIVVADIDTGVDRTHIDLQGNMWVNVGEIPSNGVDDDGNGYSDDYYGWDFYNNDNDPMDDNGHGTHTVGTIAGVGNNSIGVVGVNWQSRIMAVKFLNAGGSGYLDQGARALQYAADMGADISSNSWGCSCQSQLTDDAVRYEHDRGMVVVAAAGNNNTDALNFSPASSDSVITVGATDPNDQRSIFWSGYASNWGEKIDVTAPGSDILSTKAPADACSGYTIGSFYCRKWGTSMATPHVAGLAALLLAKNSTLLNEEIRQILRTAAIDLGAAGKDSDFGYGRVDAGNAVSQSSTQPLTPFITSPKSRTSTSATTLPVYGNAFGTTFAWYSIETGAGRSPTTWTTITNSTTPVTNGLLATINTELLSQGYNTIRLTTADTQGKRYQFQVFDIYRFSLQPTPTSIATPSATLTPTVTIPPSVTPIPSSTPTTTPFPTPTDIPTPTITPSFTPSPTPPDTSPPVVTITYPTNGGVVPRNKTISITATASDPSGVERVELFINNTLLCSDTTAPYACNWRVPARKGATYQIRATAYDTKGNNASIMISVTAQ